MLRDCTASGGGRVVLWVPDGADSPAPAGAVLVTPAMLAQEARNTLQLPEPAVGVNPDGLNQNPALVNLPTWWWVTNGEPLTQRTSLGGVWAEVTAEAVASTWTTSDGERTECAGLGMAWAPGDEGAPAGVLLAHLHPGQRGRAGAAPGRLAGELGRFRRDGRHVGALRHDG